MSIPPPELGNPQEFRISREGDRDLAFIGWLLSKRTKTTQHYSNVYTPDGQEVDAGIDICIYVTEAGRIVTHSFYWIDYVRHDDDDDWDIFNENPEQTSSGERHRMGIHKAAWHPSVEAALAWLREDSGVREDSGGRLDDIRKSAWAEACRRWPDLSPHEVEAVDAMKAHE